MDNMSLYLTIALAPLVGSLLAGLFGKQIGRVGAHSVTILSVAVSTVLSAYVLWGFIDGSRSKFDENVYTWLTMGGLDFSVGFLVDSLTAMMMVVVTSVSLMVHIYTIGYMHDEETGYQRFFSYISLFTFSMLMLVMSNNFVQLFFGWEAVGLVSYLLIGFYFKRESAIFANLKAFWLTVSAISAFCSASAWCWLISAAACAMRMCLPICPMCSMPPSSFSRAWSGR